MPTFTGTLNVNDVYAGLFNVIISQEVFADNFAFKNALVDEARVDGSLYGDTKLFYSADVLGVHNWGGDAEAGNLLALDRPKSPQTQALVLNIKKQIRVTVDYYLTKRAWMNDGSFGQFTAVTLGMLSDTKRIYDETEYNAFIGTEVGDASKPAQMQTIDVSTATTGLSGEEANRIKATTIAVAMADLIDNLTIDYSRDYTDYGNLRKYDYSDLKIVWNAKYLNEILKVDTPTIFHKEEVLKQLTGRKLPAKYFGTRGTTTATATGSSQRYLNAPDSNNLNPKFAGDFIAQGTSLAAGEYYVEDADVIAKIYVKLPPFMSGFTAGTSFFNPRSLTENHYLTFMHNTLEHLKNYPCITVKEI